MSKVSPQAASPVAANSTDGQASARATSPVGHFFSSKQGCDHLPPCGAPRNGAEEIANAIAYEAHRGKMIEDARVRAQVLFALGCG